MNNKFSISIPDNDNYQRTNKKENFKNTQARHLQHKSPIELEDSNSQIQISRYYQGYNNSQQQSPFRQFTVQKKVEPKKSSFRKHNKFQIEVPEIDFQQSGRTICNQDQNYLELTYKEPPAPSRATKNKFFNFPVIPDEISSKKKQSHKPFMKQDQLNQRIIELEHEIQNNKQKYEKQLEIKDGQIQLLQKIIKQYLERKEEVNTRDFKSIIKQKDEKNNELINKVSEMSLQVKNINSESLTYKTQNFKLHKEIQNLKNQLYIYEKNSENNKVTDDFQEIRKLQKQEKKYWEEKHKSFHNSRNSFKNIDELNKRLEILKQNRKELELEKSKQKNKSFTISNNKDQSTTSIPCNSKIKVSYEHLGGYKQKFNGQKIINKQNRTSSYAN